MAVTLLHQKATHSIKNSESHFKKLEGDSPSLIYYLSRLGAFLVDHFIGLCFYIFIGELIAKNQQVSLKDILWINDIPAWFSLIGATILLFAYFWLMESLFSRTFGKMIFHLKVTREGKTRCGFIGSTNRNMLRILDSFPIFIPGILSILLSKRPQRLGDKLAHTRVQFKYSFTYFAIGVLALLGAFIWTMTQINQ
ncbi:MAG: RDD family protein [Deltaproteobacteria bacterium]|nr:RDD family protein [Deltaproteobacteria bacterium]